MAANENQPKTDNLKRFDPYRDENGQNMGQDAPTDVANAAVLQKHLMSDPGGEAETARLASGRKNEGADEATAAEVPAANIDRISNPSLGSGSGGGGEAAAKEAMERATASLGKP